MEGGRVSHSWCMDVHVTMVSWVLVGMAAVVAMHAGQSQRGRSHVARCRSTSRVQDEGTDDTRSHCLLGA